MGFNSGFKGLKCFDSLTLEDTLTTSFFLLYLPSNGTHELQNLDEAKDHTFRILQF